MITNAIDSDGSASSTTWTPPISTNTPTQALDISYLSTISETVSWLFSRATSTFSWLPLDVSSLNETPLLAPLEDPDDLISPFQNMSLAPHTPSSSEQPTEKTTNDVENKDALKAAFAQSSEEGMNGLWTYMKEGALPKENVTEGNNKPLDLVSKLCSPDPAKQNFTEGMKKMLRLKRMQHITGPRFHQKDTIIENDKHFEARVERLLPTKGRSLDQCLDVVIQARRVVENPENSPIPEEHYGRVLAGATIAGLAGSDVAYHAALKKPANTQERLRRWTEIDPAVYRNNEARERSSFFGKVGCERHTVISRWLDWSSPSSISRQMTRRYSNDPKLKLRYGVAHLCGHRESQEDTHSVGTIGIGNTTVPFFAICDGHNGPHASLFICDNLQPTLQKTLGNKNLLTLTDFELENLLACVSVQLNDAFIQTAGSRAQAHNYCFPGTTLTMALVLLRGNVREVWTANVGDSRTLAVSSDWTYQLTEDARSDAERFKASCERAGIPVFSIPRDSIEKSLGLPEEKERLRGQLAVARAIGKKNIMPISKAKVTRIVVPKDGMTLVLYCDGLNEVSSSNDVGDVTRSHNNTTPQGKAEAIVRAAYRIGSTDNISALVVEIPPKK